MLYIRESEEEFSQSGKQTKKVKQRDSKKTNDKVMEHVFKSKTQGT